MKFTEYLKQYKDIINEPLKDFQIDYLNLHWSTPREFIYSKLVKIILVCVNKLPLYVHVIRNEDYCADISIGANKYFISSSTLIRYDDIDFNRLASDSEYAADLIMKCLTSSFERKNILEELSVDQLSKFLDMTKVVVRLSGFLLQ